jgi:hypothetical protein
MEGLDGQEDWLPMASALVCDKYASMTSTSRIVPALVPTLVASKAPVYMLPAG